MDCENNREYEEAIIMLTGEALKAVGVEYCNANPTEESAKQLVVRVRKHLEEGLMIEAQNDIGKVLRVMVALKAGEPIIFHMVCGFLVAAHLQEKTSSSVMKEKPQQ